MLGLGASDPWVIPQLALGLGGGRGAGGHAGRPGRGAWVPQGAGSLTRGSMQAPVSVQSVRVVREPGAPLPSSQGMRRMRVATDSLMDARPTLRHPNPTRFFPRVSSPLRSPSQGVRGMRVGGLRRVLVPPELVGGVYHFVYSR